MIDGIHLLDAGEFTDQRGSLLRLFQSLDDLKTGFDTTWRQGFISRTTRRNTIRGLHYQYGESAEAKLISPLNGSLVWVVVDLRAGSGTFANWRSIEVSNDANQSLLIGPGFAHGCLSLSDDAEVVILSNAEHAPEQGGGIRWDDPTLSIVWPDLGGPPVISEEHGRYPDFSHFLETRGTL